VTQLNRLRVAGWNSIRDAEIELRPLNVLIGANGAGKSNLVAFFNNVIHCCLLTTPTASSDCVWGLLWQARC
jgi:AAA15 family ATPase/GTPase